MIIARVTEVREGLNGRFIVRVICPWCNRYHDHAILIGFVDSQPPPCGTPSSYRMVVLFSARPTYQPEEIPA